MLLAAFHLLQASRILIVMPKVCGTAAGTISQDSADLDPRDCQRSTAAGILAEELPAEQHQQPDQVQGFDG